MHYKVYAKPKYEKEQKKWRLTCQGTFYFSFSCHSPESLRWLEATSTKRCGPEGNKTKYLLVPSVLFMSCYFCAGLDAAPCLEHTFSLYHVYKYACYATSVPVRSWCSMYCRAVTRPRKNVTCYCRWRCMPVFVSTMHFTILVIIITLPRRDHGTEAVWHWSQALRTNILEKQARVITYHPLHCSHTHPYCYLLVFCFTWSQE